MTVSPASMGRRPSRHRGVLVLLLCLLVGSMLLGAGAGAVKIPASHILATVAEKAGLRGMLEFLGLAWPEVTELEATVLHAIRLPRVLLAALVGGALGLSGAVLQGLFRNPLADPGLLGISSGATLAVSGAIVLHLASLGLYTLPLAAFAGSLTCMLVIQIFARHDRRTNVATMLLAGIAINSLCGAGTGLFTYFSSEDQLRAITFWMLGSLSGATWTSVGAAAPLILPGLLILPLLAGPMNAMLLGESTAQHLGVRVEWVKALVVLLIALGVGAGVAVSGMIGFVGLIVPNLIRIWTGPNHHVLLPASALLGSALLVLADMAARTVVAPLELPLGIVTAALGAPFFLILLVRQRRTGEL
ncbi:iron ABC transporter permease [Luteolibacter flavescens]|uniref:Iron ABC transporter permease n=1 Tax=Luteolibacter flavescens TaxID=1859460 RepID=A0ABT3FX19_9BACT|nr:iron ABC transporter permease [Luteolibacter flavescens]MCW1887545.1 iron ABC transporter permease [Luteolibacter flavescens]